MPMHKLPITFTYSLLKSQDYSVTEFSKKVVTLVDYFTTNDIKWNHSFIVTLVKIRLSIQYRIFLLLKNHHLNISYAHSQRHNGIRCKNHGVRQFMQFIVMTSSWGSRQLHGPLWCFLWDKPLITQGKTIVS